MTITPILIGLSRDEKMPASIKSKMLKVIKYISSDAFVDTYNPRENYRPTSRKQVQSQPDARDRGKDNLPPAGPSRRGQSAQLNEYNFADPDHEDFMRKVQFDQDERIRTGDSSKKHLQSQAMYAKAGHDNQSPQARLNSVSHKQLPSRRGTSGAAPHEPGRRDDNIQTTFDEYRPYYNHGGDPQESMYLEYVTLLDQTNTKELITFAVQNLSNIIDDCVFSIMQNKPVYLKILSLVDMHLGLEDREHQKKILLCVAKHLTEDRASDGIADGIIEKILKAFNRSGHDFHEVYAALIFSHIIKSNYDVRVNAMVEMLKTPYIKLQDLALKIMKDISKPGQPGLKRDYTVEFENHIRFILEASLSKDRSVAQVNGLIEVMSNLCINDYLSAEIIHHSGIETLLLHLREKANLEGQRLAARGLLNLGAKSRENKLRIISELNYEIKAMHRNELDPVIRSYVAALVQAKGSIDHN